MFLLLILIFSCEFAFSAMTQTLMDRGAVECAFKDETMIELFTDADDCYYKYNAGGFLLGSWVLASYNANQASRAPDHVPFYIRSSNWYYYPVSEELISASFTYTDAASGSRGCGVHTDLSTYLFDGGTSYCGGGAYGCAVTDDFAHLMVIGMDYSMFHHTGGTGWELVHDNSIPVKIIDFAKPSDIDWVVAVSTDEKLYVMKYPHAPHDAEWKEIPITGDDHGNGYHAMSVARDGNLCFISNNTFAGGYTAMYAHLFDWTCEGVDAHEDGACDSNGVCVEQDVCDCYDGYFFVDGTCTDTPPDDAPEFDGDYYHHVRGNFTEEKAIYECDTSSAIVSSRARSAAFYYQNSKVYLFGGYGVDQFEQRGYLNDVWTFDDVSHNWCFIKGNQSAGQPNNVLEGGLPLTYAQTNEPSSRSSMSSFSTVYSFVIFGGELNDELETTNELWEFSVVDVDYRHQWRLLVEESEDDIFTQPSKRSFGCMDHYGSNSDTVFLFGGQKWNNVTLDLDYYNDLWSYSILLNEFTRVRNGSYNDTFSQAESFVVESYYNKSDTDTTPPRRSKCLCWTDNSLSPNFYIFGGEFPNKFGTNDVWFFNSTLLNWNFITGGNGNSENQLASDLGYYNYDSQNIPSSRFGSISFLNQMYYFQNDGDLQNTFLFFGGQESRSGKVFADMWSFSNTLNEFKFLNGTSEDTRVTEINSEFIGSRSFGMGVMKPNLAVLMIGGSTLV